jgi:hypothetical protein
MPKFSVKDVDGDYHVFQGENVWIKRYPSARTVEFLETFAVPEGQIVKFLGSFVDYKSVKDTTIQRQPSPQREKTPEESAIVSAPVRQLDPFTEQALKDEPTQPDYSLLQREQKLEQAAGCPICLGTREMPDRNSEDPLATTKCMGCQP